MILIPKLLHRHIFKELAFLFSITLGAFLSLVLIGRLLQLRDLLLSQNLSAADIGMLFLYLSPFFLHLIIPISCMLAIFLTFLRMSTDRELVALKAGGVGIYRLLPAPLAFCVVCASLNILVSFYGISWGMENFRQTIVDLAKTKTQLVIQPGLFNTDFPGLTIYAEKVDLRRGELNMVMVQDRTRPEAKLVVVAPSGQIRSAPEKGEIHFMLENGRIYHTEKDKVGVLSFDVYAVRLDLSQLLHGYDLGEVRPKEMSFARLVELEGQPSIQYKDDGMYARKIHVELHNRLALPVACLVLGLLAVPLACAFQGVKRHYGVVVSLVLFLLYYTMYSVGVSLGETGVLDPGMGLWAPNVIIGLAGLIGLKLANGEHDLYIFERLVHLVSFRKAA